MKNWQNQKEDLELFKLNLAEYLELNYSQIYGLGLSLSDLLTESPKATNSIDLMEAFAYAFAKNGWDKHFYLPVFTLNENIDNVIEILGAQIENQTLKQSI